MKRSLKIERLSLKRDLNGIVELHRSELSDQKSLPNDNDLKGWFNLGGPWLAKELAQSYLKTMLKCNAAILVGYLEDRLVGEIEIEPIDEKNAYLAIINIHNSLQGSGLGKNMLLHAFAFLRKRGFLKLITMPESHALGFYANLGFQKILTRYEVSQDSQDETTHQLWQEENKIPGENILNLGNNQPPIHHHNQFHMSYPKLIGKKSAAPFIWKNRDTPIWLGFSGEDKSNPAWSFLWGEAPSDWVRLFNERAFQMGYPGWFSFCGEKHLGSLSPVDQVEWWEKRLD